MSLISDTDGASINWLIENQPKRTEKFFPISRLQAKTLWVAIVSRDTGGLWRPARRKYKEWNAGAFFDHQPRWSWQLHHKCTELEWRRRRRRKEKKKRNEKVRTPRRAPTCTAPQTPVDRLHIHNNNNNNNIHPFINYSRVYSLAPPLSI